MSGAPECGLRLRWACNGGFNCPLTRKRPTVDGCPIRLLNSKQDWAAWLENSLRWYWPLASAGEERLAIRVGLRQEALEVPCYGGSTDRRGLKATTWLQICFAFEQSVWSKITREKALALIANGEMKPPGWKRSRAPKEWTMESAYDSPSRATVPSDFKLR